MRLSSDLPAGLGLLLSPFTSGAQQGVARIAYLAVGTVPTSITEAFRQGLRDLGYIEGQNLIVEYRWMAGREAEVPAVLAQLIRLKIDALVATSTLPALEAKRATSTIPTVFLGGADPVAAGLITSFAKPGGNIAGLTNYSVQLGSKIMQGGWHFRAARVARLRARPPGGAARPRHQRPRRSTAENRGMRR